VPSVFILLIFLEPAVGGSTQGPGIRQADYETAIIITCAAVILLCIGPRNRLQICMTLLVVFCLAAGWLLLTLSPYEKARLVNFFSPWEEEKWHYYGSVVDIRTIIRPKGIFGVGFGHGRAKFWYLRHAHTKDIMAVASEELGWAGVISILMIFGILVRRGFQVGFGTHDPYRRYLALGVSLVVALQVLLHTGMSMAFLPFAGGVSLPLMSYGGPFLAMTLFGMGVLLNVSSRT
jgi:cell division protein FtsW